MKQIAKKITEFVKKSKRKVKFTLQVFILSRKIYFGLFI